MTTTLQHFILASEYRVNVVTNGIQYLPEVAVFSDGSSLVVWGGQDGSGNGVRARRMDASGVPIGAEFSVNVTTQGGQGTARIAKNEDDSYTIYWQSTGHAGGVGVDIVGRRFDSAGVAVSDEFIVNTTMSQDQLWTQATTLADGRHLVTWANANASGTMISVSGRIIGADGVGLGDDFVIGAISGITEANWTPTLTSLTDGGFLALWKSSDGSGSGVFARRYDADGNAAGAAFRVNAAITADQQIPGAVALPDGGFVITWTSGHGSRMGIYAQRYDAAGAKTGGEFQVNTITTANHYDSRAYAMPNGGFIVTYSVGDGRDGSGSGVYAQRYDANCVRMSGEFRLSETTAGNQYQQALSVRDDGSFVVVWASPDGDSQGVYSRVFSPAVAPYLADAERRVNVDTAGIQRVPTVTVFSNGSSLVTWGGFDNSGNGVRARRLDAAGNPEGAEFAINTITQGGQDLPCIARNGDDSYTIYWHSSGNGSAIQIVGQRYDATGAAISGEFTVNTGADNKLRPQVSTLVDGRHIVTWMNLNANDVPVSVSGRLVASDGAGLGDEFLIGSISGVPASNWFPTVASLADGGFVAMWKSADGSGSGIYARRFDAAGAATGSAFRINATTANDQQLPSATGLPDGGFVVAWTSNGQDGSGNGIYAQRYNAGGVKVGGEFRVNTVTAANQYDSQVFALPDGGFIIAYTAGDAQDGDGAGIYAQRYDANCVKVGPEFQISLNAAGNQHQQSLAVRDDGALVFVWASPDGDGQGIYSRLVHTTDPMRVVAGGPGDDNLVGGEGRNRVIGGDGDDLIHSGSGFDRLDGGAGNDTIFAGDGDVATGGAGFDTLWREGASPLSWDVGGAGFEEVHGGSGNDKLWTSLPGSIFIDGGAGSDTLIGGDGDDTLDGGSGADSLIGGGGNDVYYVDDPGDVVVELADEGVDEVRADLAAYTLGANLEKLTYTGAGDFAGTGNALDNALNGAGGADTLSGGDGDDTLAGGGGADVIDGGNGSDTADYSTSTAAVAVDLEVGTAAGGDAAGDTLISIENLTGSAHNDVLTGDGGANVLDGGSGDDLLEGRGGDDTLIGGAGTDTAVFSGNVADYLAIKSGAVWTFTDMAGGDGVDTLTGIEQAQFADRQIYLDGRNNAPLVNGDLSAATDEDAAPLVVNLLQGAADIDIGDVISVGGFGQTGGRTVAFTRNGADFTFDPTQFNDLAVGESAVVSFGYTVTDGAAATPQTLTITVNGRNDAPTARDDAFTTVVGGTSIITLAALQSNDFDSDTGDMLSVIGTANVSHGTLATDTAGNLLFTAAVGYAGAAGFDYTVSDNYGGVATAHVTVTASGAGGRYVSLQGGSEARDGVASTVPQTDDQHYVAVLSDNSYVKVWWTGDDNTSDIYARHYSTAGSPLGAAFIVNTTVALNQGAATVTALADGGYVIGWYTTNGTLLGNTPASSIYQQRFTATDQRVGGETQVSTQSGSTKTWPTTTALSDGGWVTVWQSNNQISGASLFDVYGQRFNADGSKAGNEFLINTSTAAHQANPSITTLADGGFLVGWWTNQTQGSGPGIFVQRYDAVGTKVGEETKINTAAINNSYQYRTVVANLDNGGYAVVWASGNSSATENGIEVIGRLYTASGAAATTEFRINQTTAGKQDGATVVQLADGGLMTAWRSYDAAGQTYAVMGRRFNAQGQALGNEFQISDGRYSQIGDGEYSRPSIDARTDGGFVVYWQDTTQGSNAFISKVFSASTLIPVIDLQDSRLTVGDVQAVSALLAPGHAQNPQWANAGLQQLSWYEFNDQTDGMASGYFTLDGVRQGAGTVISVSASDLGRVAWHAGTGIGSDAVQIRGFDGQQWSAWTGATLTTAATTASFQAGNEFRDTGDAAVWQTDDQQFVAALTGGGYIKVWWTADGNTSDVYARHYDSAGAPVGAAFLVNTTTAQNQSGATVTALADGGYVIGWYSMNGSIRTSPAASTVYQQRFDANDQKVGVETQVSTQVGSVKAWPMTSALSDGGWVTVWQSNNQVSASSAYDIYGQRYGASGTKVGSEFLINTTTAQQQAAPTVAELIGSGFVVGWWSNQATGNGPGIYVQRYDTSGAKTGSEMRINTTALNTSYQYRSALSELDNGGFAVSWSSVNTAATTDNGIELTGRIFDASGIAITAEFQINQTTSGKQDGISIEQLTDGSLIAAWRSYDSAGQTFAIMGRRFDTQGQALGDEFQISDSSYSQAAVGEYSHPSLSALASGGFVAYWQDPTPGAISFVSKVFQPNNTQLGIYRGTDGNDTLFGSSGSDTLTGGLGADAFRFENPNVGVDTITDFQLGVDRIEVLAAEFDNLPIGQLSADRFSSDGVMTADTRFIFDPNTRVLSYDADGSGAGAAVGLATLNTAIFNYTGVFVTS